MIALGGLTAAIVRTGIAQSTWLRWRRLGRISDAVAVLRIEELTGIPARELAGMENGTPTPTPHLPDNGAAAVRRSRRTAAPAESEATPLRACVGF